MPGANTEIARGQFSRTTIKVEKFLQERREIPNAVWYGSMAVTPESYMLALAEVTQALVSEAQPPRSVRVLPGELTASQWVAKDSPSIWNWPISRRDFIQLI